ncbi:MAG: OsmC family protein [Anaerolineae bacterium]|nr:OsmC family protein [Gemmatimonadaceae bacterium]
MLGTLNGALEVRGLKLPAAAIAATAQGENSVVDGIIRLTEIRVAYRLRIPAANRDLVERALSKHQEKCPTAASLSASVRISWTAEIEETSSLTPPTGTPGI